MTLQKYKKIEYFDMTCEKSKKSYKFALSKNRYRI
jgi:hypothetical protein